MATRSGPPDPPDAAAEPPEDRADRLRERVYVAFTTLAVVIAMRSGHVGSAEEASLLLAHA